MTNHQTLDVKIIATKTSLVCSTEEQKKWQWHAEVSKSVDGGYKAFLLLTATAGHRLCSHLLSYHHWCCLTAGLEVQILLINNGFNKCDILYAYSIGVHMFLQGVFYLFRSFSNPLQNRVWSQDIIMKNFAKWTIFCLNTVVAVHMFYCMYVHYSYANK